MSTNDIRSIPSGNRAVSSFWIQMKFLANQAPLFIPLREIIGIAPSSWRPPSETCRDQPFSIDSNRSSEKRRSSEKTTSSNPSSSTSTNRSPASSPSPKTISVFFGRAKGSCFHVFSPAFHWKMARVSIEPTINSQLPSASRSRSRTP